MKGGVRDLQRSHKYRESVNKWGPPRTRHRVHIVHGPSDNSPGKEVDISPKKYVKPAPLDDELFVIDREIEKKRKEHELLKSWVGERKSIRKALDKIGFTESWYKHKPSRTESEKRVHDQVCGKGVSPANQVRRLSVKKKVQKKESPRRVSTVHVEMLPFVESSLPLALAIIADYLQEKRLRLVDLYRNVDRNKDWSMSREELKLALQRIEIPLSEEHLDELIFSLDVDHDDELSYKELASGIDTYYKDRRWQNLKKVYDKTIDENEEELKGMIKNSKIPTSLINLPQMDIYNETMQLNRQRARARERRRKKEEEDKLGKSNMKPALIASLFTALTEKKMTHMQSLKEECERVVDLLHELGIHVRERELKRLIVPPKDNPVELSMAYLSAERSIFPNDHPDIELYRRRQTKKLKNLKPLIKDVVVTQLRPNVEEKKSGETPLPRVASLDFKQRRLNSRRERRERQNASPTPYWPQHLLDKVRLCMDDNLDGDGKTAIFQTVSPDYVSKHTSAM